MKKTVISASGKTNPIQKLARHQCGGPIQTQNVRNLFFNKERGVFFNRGFCLYTATLLKAQDLVRPTRL